ncbi:MAG TPA: Gfo/Idh/MocA family oxidoreductase [Termitinemataceae bacterium]|uniref:Gfo/Idh/MocA family protein n=1 Tax=Treponema sp. J25 TaxID=2094121 RepID=UPI00104C7DC1|nr:Gfo/Idh/MocA family oxidoreductase [Treponema sp. J25]TCW62149.1 gfo/Idh/MocA family oxidoreductase [Treponema sp. J25]HOJ98973.1 Gfo/Idh/MocA family oxidoreductase [Termitinemataceae bacterium]HOM23235.1 Gfo/Idh/MocA family oxidoreductase [Termitinemataceae bacterium]HPQ00218.1 Gfo/Idh/MocA family oxidoreductase [Termitinemataceae bacterium]
MTRLRMGVLGCSAHYAKRVAVPLRESLLIEPYGVASRDLSKAQEYAKRWGFAKAYGSYEALLADKDIDFVYIPLPNHMHLEYIKKAADAGKPVLCEKPLTLNALEAREVVDYCTKKGIPLMEAFMYRFHPQWQRARELVQAGEVGQVQTMHTMFCYNNRDPRNIRNIAEYGGGALLDIGCYAVSSARFLMGAQPIRVVAQLLEDPDFKTDILVSGILDFGEGRRSTFTVGTQLFSMQKVDIYGTGGSMSIEVPFNMYGDVPGRIFVATDVGRRVIETEVADQYLLEFDAFARALIEKIEVPTPPIDAIENMAVLDALARSARSGTWEAV